MNLTKSVHITSTVYKQEASSPFLNIKAIPQNPTIKYLKTSIRINNYLKAPY